MWRPFFLQLSANPWMRRTVTGTGVGRKLALRFVAGESLDDAIAATKEVNRRGASAEIDYLGENVTERQQAEAAGEAYLQLLDGIAASGIDAQVSLKPTQMGMDLGPKLCRENVEKIVARATAHGNFVWIDMEGSAYTDRTLQLYRDILSRHPNVGLAIQAYLYRTREDLQDLMARGGTVRLCKGAYGEPSTIAFPRKSDVDLNFRALTETLLSSGRFQAIATHDEKMIQHAVEYARARGLDRQQYEFQLLHGVRRDLQEQLLREGYRVRVYIPFGDEWYPYFVRRLAERPANLLFLLSNIAREASSRR